MENKYNKINTREKYESLLKSGMFWEFYPELSGEYDKDIINVWWKQEFDLNEQKHVLIPQI